MESNDIRNVVIVGSGPSGLTSAIYTARANLKPVVAAGISFGGQLMTTTEVENFPGFPEGIKGPELMQKMLQQAERFGAEIVYNDVTKLELEGEIKKVTIGDKVYLTRAVIIATGASSRTLGLPAEQVYWGKGVSTCATCDGAFYRNRIVAVIGGGDSAMEEALFLTRFATKVYVIHRREEFRASKIMQQRVIEHEKIEVLWNTEIKDILGEGKVQKLQLFNNKTNTESELDVDGFFLAIGHKPNSTILESQLELDENGYILATNHTNTNIEGVFVAGDVHDHHYRQAITAAGMGCMAAIDAERWLAAKFAQ